MCVPIAIYDLFENNTTPRTFVMVYK